VLQRGYDRYGSSTRSIVTQSINHSPGKQLHLQQKVRELVLRAFHSRKIRGCLFVGLHGDVAVTQYDRNNDELLNYKPAAHWRNDVVVTKARLEGGKPLAYIYNNNKHMTFSHHHHHHPEDSGKLKIYANPKYISKMAVWERTRADA
jgi:hypothetical protein